MPIDPVSERVRQLVVAVAAELVNDADALGAVVEAVLDRHGDSIYDAVYGLTCSVVADLSAAADEDEDEDEDEETAEDDEDEETAEEDEP